MTVMSKATMIIQIPGSATELFVSSGRAVNYVDVCWMLDYKNEKRVTAGREIDEESFESDTNSVEYARTLF